MFVRITKVRPGCSLRPGQILNTEKRKAERWIRSGFAEEIVPWEEPDLSDRGFCDDFRPRGKVLNVLTRTANRPNRFRRCRESLLAQESNITIRHFVSIDRPTTYAEGDVLVPATGKISPPVPRSHSGHRIAPYNLYVNDLLEAVADGWILILDDDDEMLCTDAVAALDPYMDDPDKLIICKFAMGIGSGKKSVVMPRGFGDELVLNDVPCSCVVFHSKHKDKAYWHGKYSGDYFAISNLAEDLEVVWVDKVVAGTQRGPSAGKLSSVESRPWEPRAIEEEKTGLFLSIVIPVMNQAHYTRDVLDNIRQTVHMPFEIIVINNGSTDETPSLLRGCRVVKNKKNAGISVSWNQGCKLAKGTHIAILNNDIVLPDYWAEALIAHGKDAICPMYSQGKKSREKPLVNDTRRAKPPGVSPDGFSGFCFLISRDAWERTGPFDERYFYWFSDRDYYHRLNDMGFQCVQAMDVMIHHYGSQTLSTCQDFDAVKAREYQLFKEDWPDDPL